MRKQREPRFRPHQAAILKVLGAKPRWLRTTVLDFSDDGMRLGTAVPIVRGTSIEVDVNGSYSLAVVCRCTADGDSFLIGVQLQRGSG